MVNRGTKNKIKIRGNINNNRRSVNSKRFSPSFHTLELHSSYWVEDFIDELMHELLSQLQHVREEHRLSRNWPIFALNKKKHSWHTLAQLFCYEGKTQCNYRLMICSWGCNSWFIASNTGTKHTMKLRNEPFEGPNKIEKKTDAISHFVAINRRNRNKLLCAKINFNDID
jgi:hypothetical protein